ncbi:ArsR/SmtB family transcription factor [Streptomyces indicus]|uniref:DNA-binding transcriptional regulator, ArsR family n=1 Tax=Streptomyces indicus TaxID=417292 RepID=A0A1G9CDM3_9ACTN|nr:metalloregulator ArsR/SmtB family transcription factor [Streptomyces indicus]SDK49771.1 DNA-binding transcriptional regulator, ArsR family [Streptomyces indicus]
MDTQQQDPGPHPDVTRAVAVLKAAADPTRFTILWALTQGERPVGQLAELTGAHVAAVSQHLARLRTAGLVTSRREGTRIYYRAAGEHVRALLEDAFLTARALEESGASEAAPESAEAGAKAPAKARTAKAAGSARTRKAAVRTSSGAVRPATGA